MVTSAGKLRPLSGVVEVGETTATVGIANFLGIVSNHLSLPELRNKATDPGDQKQCSPREQDKAVSAASPDWVCFMFIGTRSDAARKSGAHISEVFYLWGSPQRGGLMEHFLSVFAARSDWLTVQ